MEIRKITKRKNGLQLVRLPKRTFTTSYVKVEEVEEGVLLKPVEDEE